jgi:hypothetical protein
MKNLLGFLFILFFLSACSKDDNRRSGVCYCEFVNGKKQEYDLTHLSRQEQITQCNIHDSNAANFGGNCKLK